MAGTLERALSIIALLAKCGGSMQLAEISDALSIPRSGTHRLLATLIDEGYVRQDEVHGEYSLALKLVSLALIYLSMGGVLDISQPVLDRLAEASGELARLGVVEDDHIIFVAKAQGAKSGLRYDPDMGSRPPLHCTASGQAWLSSMSDDAALTLVAKEGGIGDPHIGGPEVVKTLPQFLKALRAARQRGYGLARESYEAGMTSIGAVVRHPISGAVVGIISLAGPSTRLTDLRVDALETPLLEAARDMSAAVLQSPFFKPAK